MAINGVSYYTKASVEIYFPEDKVCCAMCPLMETYARKQCRRTGFYIADDRTIEPSCPLQFRKDNEDGKNV